MISAATIILALLTVLITVLVGRSIRKQMAMAKNSTDKRKRRLQENRATHFLDTNEMDDTCEICFGDLCEGTVAVCRCGKRFHKECVEMTDECPYCQTKPGAMTYRPVSRPVCNVCGRPLSGNVCVCGNVVPRKDMTFECTCGETVIAKNGSCPKCGAKYAFTYESPRKPI